MEEPRPPSVVEHAELIEIREKVQEIFGRCFEPVLATYRKGILEEISLNL